MKYRILLINWQDIANPLGGGAEVHAHEIFRRIASWGHEVTQLSCTFHGAQREELIDGIRVIRRGLRSIFNLSVPSAYRALNRIKQFDIVFDDINKIPFCTPLFVKEPVVAIVHHLFGESIFLETGWPQALYVRASERAIPKIYSKTRLIAVSESTRRELNESGLRCNRIDIVHNGVDSQRFFVRPGMKSREPLIGYMGRLKRYKCIEHLIRALPRIVERVPDVRLLVVGRGDHRSRLERYAADLGLSERVSFSGGVNNDEKVAYLNKMWVVVNPSPKEGWGLTVIEANACGIPVVAADSPGLRDSVMHEQTGFLYPWGDIEILADRVVQVLIDKALRRRLGQNARSWAERFRWNDSAMKTVGIIEDVLNRTRF
jgi:glycosyltransferase involved in cell wall biosynthesis